MAPTELTAPQLTHLDMLCKICRSVIVDGHDLAGRIVVTRTDRRDTVQYAIRKDGSGTNAQEPIRQFTVEELYEFSNDEFHLLTRLTGVTE